MNARPRLFACTPPFWLVQTRHGMPKIHAGRCKIITPRNDLVTECREKNHYLRYEIMTEGMEKKKS